MSTGVKAAIDSHWEANEEPPRPHLGASQIGKECERMLVYSFRHATVKKTKGRMLRLFNRGHLEEIRLVAWLRSIGLDVREYEQRLTYHEASGSYAASEWHEPLMPGLEDVSGHPEHVAIAAKAGVKLRQWSFKDHGGHYSGSTDGMALVPEKCLRVFSGLPVGKPFGLEFKTYNTKGFTGLVEAKSVRIFRPEHYAQAQEYMHYMGLEYCLYLAINKNDDDLYDELIPYDREFAEALIAKAKRVIAARQLPKRISNSPTWFACKFCDYRGVCHYGEPLLKSCRTCKHVAAVTEGTDQRWFCGQWNALIPPDVVKLGCDHWSPITD